METDPYGVWQGNTPPFFYLIFLPSLKLECEKLASEKTEMQRHYVMVRVPAHTAHLHVLPKKGRLGYQALFYGCPPIFGTACLSHLFEPKCWGFPDWVPMGLRVFVSCPDTHTPHPRLHPIRVPDTRTPLRLHPISVPRVVPHQCP